jgi:hypothetical protein
MLNSNIVTFVDQVRHCASEISVLHSVTDFSLCSDGIIKGVKLMYVAIMSKPCPSFPLLIQVVILHNCLRSVTKHTVTRLVTVDGYWIDNRIYYNSTLKYNTTESLRTPSVLQFTTEYITTIPQPSNCYNPGNRRTPCSLPSFPWIPTHSTGNSNSPTTLQQLPGYPTL